MEKKLVFECGLLHADLLFEAVAKIEGVRRSQLLSAGEAHLTVLFIGNRERLNDEIEKISPGLDGRFLESLAAFETWLLVRGQEQFDAIATEVRVLTSRDSSYLVAGVVPSPELAILRRDAWDGLIRLVGQHGVLQPKQFIYRSEALQVPGKSWQPHITLAKGMTPSRWTHPLRHMLHLGPLRLHE